MRSDLSPLEDALYRGGMSLHADSGLPLGDVQTLRPKGIRVIPAPKNRWAIEWEQEGAELTAFEHDPSDCLRDYLDLFPGNGPERILSFVKRYGVLGRCEHWSAPTDPTLCERCTDADMVREWHPSYDAFPYLFGMLLEGAARSQEGDPLPEDLCRIVAEAVHEDYQEIQRNDAGWLLLGGLAFTIIGPTLHHSLLPELCVNRSIRIGSDPGPAPISYIRFGLNDLLGVLVLKLAAVLSSSNGVFVCSFCRRPYWPEDGQYRPRRNQRHLCSDKCRRGIRAQDERERWLRNHPQQQRKSKYRQESGTTSDSAVL